MTVSPLVSVVTPSFNQAAFIEQTLRSVLEQDYPAIEYLVADGASTDGSVEIIQKYADRLAWWVSEKDHGQAEAINKGFTKATGKYIAWVNSDDYYLPGAIRAAVEVLEANPTWAWSLAMSRLWIKTDAFLTIFITITGVSMN
jgi:glycosyltransferase involved in cell wall biosynthesis